MLSFLPLVANAAAVVAALAASAAAIASYIQTWRAKRLLEVQLFLNFSERYNEPAIGDGIILLLNWRKAHPHDFAEVWFEMYQRSEKDALELERARRALSRYFTDIARLYRAGKITKTFAFTLLGHFGLDVYYEICYPMWNKFYGSTAPDFVPTLKSLRPNYVTPGTLGGPSITRHATPSALADDRDSNVPT